MKHLLVASLLLPLSFCARGEDDLLQSKDGAKAAATEPARVLTARISPGAQKVLDQMKEAYAHAPTLKLAGAISYVGDVEGKKENLSDRVSASFEAPNKFHHEMTENIIAGSTGEKVYALSLNENTFVQGTAPKSPHSGAAWPKPVWDVVVEQNPSLAMALSADAEIQLIDVAAAAITQIDGDIGADELEKGTQVTRGDDAVINGVPCTILKLTNPGGDFTFAVDPKTHLLREMQVDQRKIMEKMGLHDVKQSLLTLDYTQVEAGAGIDEKQFAWVPPASARELTAAAPARGNIEDGAANALVGKPAPDFKLVGFDGKPVSLAEQKGSVVVVDFWATWCGPCVASLPHLNKLYEDRKAAGLKVFAISVDQDKSKVKPFIEQNKYTFHVLFEDDAHKTSEKYGVTGIPQTVVIGKDGIIKKVIIGFGGDEGPLAQAVDEAMK